MNGLKRIASLIALVLLPSISAAMDNPVHLSVIQGWQQDDGTRIAGIRIDLDDGWKTYWRAPGEAGIPPYFDFTSSKNLGAFEVEWPAPAVFDQGGMTTVGYKDFVIFPVILTPIKEKRRIDLRGELQLGVCKDVCLPVSLELDAVIEKSGSDRDPALAAAMAARPFDAQEVGVSNVTCKLEPDASGLALSAHVTMPSAGRNEFTVFESTDPDHWLAEAQSERRGDTLIATSVLSSMSGQDLMVDRSDIRITVLGSDYAVDIKGCTGG